MDDKVTKLRWKLVKWLCGAQETAQCREAITHAAKVRKGTAVVAPLSASIRLPPPFETVIGDVWFLDKHAKDSVAVEFYKVRASAVFKLFLFLPDGQALESLEGWDDFGPGAILEAVEKKKDRGYVRRMSWEEAEARLAEFWARSLGELRRWMDRQGALPG
jgi:hypothetical protein